MSEMLYQTYRPRQFTDFVGHRAAVRAIQCLMLRGLGGRAFWISGPSGIGKTTLAYLLAAEVADPINWEEIDAGQCMPRDVDELERRLRSRALGEKLGRAVLVNESHGLRQDAIRKLLVVLERIPRHVTWIFTTTDAGNRRLFREDAHPLLSRCMQIELTVDGYKNEMVQRAKEIAEREGLGSCPLGDYYALAERSEWNFREVLNQIELGAMLEHQSA